LVCTLLGGALGCFVALPNALTGFRALVCALLGAFFCGFAVSIPFGLPGVARCLGVAFLGGFLSVLAALAMLLRGSLYAPLPPPPPPRPRAPSVPRSPRWSFPPSMRSRPAG